MVGLAMFVLFPMLVVVTVVPIFPLNVRAAVGLSTIGAVVYTLTFPKVALVVFGVWGAFAPGLLYAFQIPFLSLVGLAALSACWLPFGFGALLTLALR